MRGFHAAVAVVGSLVLAACQRPEAPPGVIQQALAPAAPSVPVVPAVSYACESGRAVAVAYPDAVSAQLAYRNRTWALRSDPAAAGARYVGATLEWWAETSDVHETATLSRLSPAEQVGPVVLERCSRPLASPPVPPPPPPPAADRASMLAPCRGAHLALSAQRDDAVANKRVVRIAVRNTGSQPCRLLGYPGVSVEDERGQTLPVRSEQSAGGHFTANGLPAPVALRPEGFGAFEIAWNVPPPGQSPAPDCAPAARLRVTPPADPEAVSLDYPLVVCGGRIRVTPMRASPTGDV